MEPSLAILYAACYMQIAAKELAQEHIRAKGITVIGPGRVAFG